MDVGRKEPQLVHVARNLVGTTGNAGTGEDKGIGMKRKSNTQIANRPKIRDSKGLALSSRSKTEHAMRDFDNNIVLKLADHPDAFIERKEVPSSAKPTSSEPHVRRKVGRLDTNELDLRMLELKTTRTLTA
ncbi:Nn.00g012810.m01.CDS01 [Neocucurbitaria sp. VM-36]